MAMLNLVRRKATRDAFRYVSWRAGKFLMAGNSRAKSIDDAEGVVKVIAHKKTDKILGVHIMDSNAGELIHEAALAIAYDTSSEDIARTCHTHPTLSEALKEAAIILHPCLFVYL